MTEENRLSKEVRIPMKLIDDNFIICDTVIIDKNLYILSKNNLLTDKLVSLLVVDSFSFAVKERYNFNGGLNGIFYDNEIYIIQRLYVNIYNILTFQKINAIKIDTFNIIPINYNTDFNRSNVIDKDSNTFILNNKIYLSTDNQNNFNVFDIFDRKVFSYKLTDNTIKKNCFFQNSDSLIAITNNDIVYFNVNDNTFVSIPFKEVINTNVSKTEIYPLSRTAFIVNNILYDCLDNKTKILFTLPHEYLEKDLAAHQKLFNVHKSNEIEPGVHAIDDKIIIVSKNHITPYNVNEYSQDKLILLKSRTNNGEYIPKKILKERSEYIRDLFLDVGEEFGELVDDIFQNIILYTGYIKDSIVNSDYITQLIDIATYLSDEDVDYLLYLVAYIIYSNIAISKVNGDIQFQLLTVLFNKNYRHFYICLTAIMPYVHNDVFLEYLKKFDPERQQAKDFETDEEFKKYREQSKGNNMYDVVMNYYIDRLTRPNNI